MFGARTRNLRRRSGRSWLFRSLRRAATLQLLIVLAIWFYSASHYAYYIGDHLTIGAAKGMVDIMLATGDAGNFAYFTFDSAGLDDPAIFYRPNLSKSDYVRPLGFSSGSFSGRMPFEEQLGLRMVYWHSHQYPALSFIAGGRTAGTATRQDLQIPFWTVALPLFALCILFYVLDRPIPDHICVRCRYDLTGNASGVCPECGTSVEQPRELEPSRAV